MCEQKLLTDSRCIGKRPGLFWLLAIFEIDSLPINSKVIVFNNFLAQKMPLFSHDLVFLI